MVAAAFAIASAGPGAWSLDNAIGLDGGGEGWGLLALAAGILGGIGALLSARGTGRVEPKAPAPATAPQPAAEPRFGREPEHEPIDRP